MSYMNDIINWRKVGKRLRRVRLRKSKEEAAAACRVTLRTYRRYEGGARQQTAAFLNFSEAYDVSLDWLALGDTARLGAHLSRLSSGKLAILKIVSGPGAGQALVANRLLT